MLSANELIEALKKGREVRPTKISGALWEGENSACALGAIALGLGMIPIVDESDPDFYSNEEKVYDELFDKVPRMSKIWGINDDSWLHGKMRRDPDKAVIEYIEENF